MVTLPCGEPGDVRTHMTAECWRYKTPLPIFHTEENQNVTKTQIAFCWKQTQLQSLCQFQTKVAIQTEVLFTHYQEIPEQRGGLCAVLFQTSGFFPVFNTHISATALACMYQFVSCWFAAEQQCCCSGINTRHDGCFWWKTLCWLALRVI